MAKKINKKGPLFYVLYILGGGLRQNYDGSWRTTNFNDSPDHANALGDYLRVIATVVKYNELHKKHQNILVITSGGRGKYSGVKKIPAVSSVLKKELIEFGVPKNIIIEDNKSGSTFQELFWLGKNIKSNWSKIILISNQYHLPRIRAMIKHKPELKKLESITVLAAEKILLEKEFKKWEKIIKKGYRSNDIKKILILEKKGVREIKNKTYLYKQYGTN